MKYRIKILEQNTWQLDNKLFILIPTFGVIYQKRNDAFKSFILAFQWLNFQLGFRFIIQKKGG